jgi:hypothetical protein
MGGIEGARPANAICLCCCLCRYQYVCSCCHPERSEGSRGSHSSTTLRPFPAEKISTLTSVPDPLQEPSFRPKSLALLRAAQRRNPLLHLDSRSTTAPTCRCPLLLSFSFANHKKPLVILTLSEVEWGRTPAFVFAFVFVVACSFSQTRGIVIRPELLTVLSVSGEAEKSASQPVQEPPAIPFIFCSCIYFPLFSAQKSHVKPQNHLTHY